MTDQTSGHKILVGVDGSRANRPALVWALEEAKARNCAVVATYAWHIPPVVFFSPGYLPIATDDLAEEGQRLVAAAVGTLAADRGVEAELRSVEGPPDKALQGEAKEPGVDLIVVGTRGHGPLASLFLGSTSHALSHCSPKPLVIVPVPNDKTQLTSSIRHIVVGLDGSEAAEAALRWAVAEAKLHDALLEIVVAWSWTTMPAEVLIDVQIEVSLEVAAKEILSKALERLDQRDLEVKLTVREGSAPEVLLDLTGSADLLVVGTRGIGRAKEKFLGSTSHLCSHRSPIPVVIVPHEIEEEQSEYV